ncbi:gliding motility-associated C-terminal domain-containing protein [Panacibacter ginsenosidivorans]|nr:gliding motility-associated C-terminal domain-containing protein [Panacibacter ginsenosidivorans]
MAGNVHRYNSLLQDGWLTKFSSNGTVQWSRHYKTNVYNYVVLNTVIAVEDENFILAGNVGNVDTSFPITHLSQYAFLIKVNKYGNPIWSKILGKINVTSLTEPFSDVSGIEITKEGDYILAVNYLANKDYNVIVRTDKNGNTKWATIIQSTIQHATLGAPKIKQLKNGAIVSANFIGFADDAHPYQQQGYYFTSLNSETGALNWERFLLDTDTLSFTQKVFGEITGFTELPGGKLRFISSYADTKYFYGRETKKLFNYITDSLGFLSKVISYTNDSPPLYASSGTNIANTGNRVILMDNADTAFLMEVEPEGNIKWQKSYPGLGRSQETNALFSTEFGHYFFSFTQNGGSKFLQLIKTDPFGNGGCIGAPKNIKANDATTAFINRPIHLVYQQPSVQWNDFSLLSSADYFIKGEYGCKQLCCTDVTDTASKINLCNISSYILPNNDTIKNSGTYTIKFKTIKGCDSLVYYNVDFAFTPQLSLGADRCLGQKDTIILKTQEGYTNYVWDGLNTTENTFSVHEPGVYKVNVTNRCGFKEDTINVFKQCEFEIHMPNAFTPNGDNVNDIFRVPPQVNNLLVSFTVFNRWGQIVFRTSNISEGWNGMLKNYPAPSGTYVYYVVMKSIDGRKNISKSGYLTLVR